MVKYATAIRLGTAETEAILRRFTRNNVQHPTYKAFAELGKAVKTVFLCRYLHSEELRREIHEGLNVIEQWNGATDFVFFARRGELVSNRHEDHETSMLCLHLLQNSMVYINTLDATHPGQARMGDADDADGFPSDHAAGLGAHQPVWPVRSRHGKPTRYLSASLLVCGLGLPNGPSQHECASNPEKVGCRCKVAAKILACSECDLVAAARCAGVVASARAARTRFCSALARAR